MNRSSKYGFYLPQNTDPISVSDFNYNFDLIDSNLITESQSLTSEQKSTARENIDAAQKFTLVEEVTGVTATMLNCTYTTNTANIVQIRKLLGGNLIYIRVRIRGDITAVGNPAYSIISLNGLNIDGFDTARAVCCYREASKNILNYDPGTVIMSTSNGVPQIQIQQVGGITVNSWKTGTTFYIDVDALLIK